MAHRVMTATALALCIAAAALALQSEPPAERVATRAEMMATHSAKVALPVACAPGQPQRVHTDI